MSKKNEKRKRKKLYTTIEDHTRDKKLLHPPFVAKLPLSPIFVRNDVLPEMIWAALILSQCPRGNAHGGFKIVLDFVEANHGKSEAVWDIRLSGFSHWPEDLFSELLKIFLRNDKQKKTLRPLLLFDMLPARAIWLAHIASNPESCDWDLLSNAVSDTLDTKSKHSNDCHRLRAAAAIIGRKVNLSSATARTAKAILHFSADEISPGDASLIRATSNALVGSGITKSHDTTWPKDFWTSCFRSTPCIAAKDEPKIKPFTVGTTLLSVKDVKEALVQHWINTRESSDIDAKHDGAFGIAFYSLAILEELLHVGNSSSIVGRLALRTLVECRINLEYLSQKDSKELWDKFRKFGVGQAKLSFLKIDEIDRSAKFIDKELLRDLANEDMSEELVSIDLGEWEGGNLRFRAETVGLKEDYDLYYGWSSQFVHGMWGGVRHAVIDVCANPTHRFHSIPKMSSNFLPDLLPDACKIVDGILDSLNSLYNGFDKRVTVNSVQGY